MAWAEWFPPLCVGMTFSALGLLKLWGLSKGIVGGAGRPLTQRLCGT